MPDPNMQLLARAEQHIPTDPDVRDCWAFVIEGIKLGWLSPNKVRKLIGHLRQHEHYGLDELLFEEVDDRLRVSFLDNRAECSTVTMIEELESLLVP